MSRGRGRKKTLMTNSGIKKKTACAQAASPRKNCLPKGGGGGGGLGGGGGGSAVSVEGAVLPDQELLDGRKSDTIAWRTGTGRTRFNVGKRNFCQAIRQTGRPIGDSWGTKKKKKKKKSLIRIKGGGRYHGTSAKFTLSGTQKTVVGERTEVITEDAGRRREVNEKENAVRHNRRGAFA